MEETIRFAERRAPLFAAIVTIAFLVFLILVIAVGTRLPRPYLFEAEGAVGRLLMAAVAVAVLSSFGWLSSAGLGSLGEAKFWLLIVPPLIYVVIVYSLLFTGTLALNLHDPLLSALVAGNGFAAGVMEEIVFRGLILCALLRHWGRSGAGITKSLLLSSVLFSLPHALNIFAGSDPLRTSAQVIWAFLLGIGFGSLVVAGGSLWPVAALHGLSNAFVHVNRLDARIETSVRGAAGLVIAAIPPLIYALLILAKRRSDGVRPSARRPESPAKSRP